MDISNIPQFDRNLFGSSETFTRIGEGSIGGKASGLFEIKDNILSKIDYTNYRNITVNIPVMTVLATDIFDEFMESNNLYEQIENEDSDERIAHLFLNSDFPSKYVGDLLGLIEKVKQPLAIRSSSLLEDAINHPFAGVYGTKMIPNNQPDSDSRFKKLVEAIKFVYASTFFKEAADYIKVTGKSVRDEKMAVIIQEVVGQKFGNNFYPNLSGVGRSYNFYPFGHADSEDGVLVFALGLGKTIVDGGKTWSICPKYPKQPPPYNSTQDIIKQTQSEFWSVLMGKPKVVDPLKEAEFLTKNNIEQAEYDDTLKYIASTYIQDSDKIVIGVGNKGPRVLDFAPLIRLNEIPLVDLMTEIMNCCKEVLKADVEIEFAVTINSSTGSTRIGMLQVRPMRISESIVDISDSELSSPNLLLSSDRILGDGSDDSISDIIYVKRDNFNAKDTPQIANDIAGINTQLNRENKKYLLIGFGRWGSSDPWLGIPVVWSQISNARVIVEATLPEMDVDLSQGAHFFHNLTSFGIFSFSVHHAGQHRINYEWLDKQVATNETEFIKHLKLDKPLSIKANSKKGLGVILYD